LIVDFKCGRADGAIDQVLTYCAAARDGLRLDVSNGCVGQVISLDASPDERVMRFIAIPEEIEEAAERVRHNVAAMRALLEKPVANVPKAASAFPQTQNARTCRACTYRALCWPELHSITRAPQPTGPTSPAADGLAPAGV
jgi:hypothetical protein